MKKLATLILISFMALTGCVSATLADKRFQSYAVGQILTASVGDAFLVSQGGSVRTVKSWVGFVNSPDGWKIQEIYSPDYIRKELIYSGHSKNTIEIAYREFRGGLAAPAFFQTVKYDLSESRTVNFQNFTILIIEAGNNGLKAKVLSD